MQHEEQLTLYDGAKNKLQEYGIKPHISALRQVDKDIAELDQKQILYEKKYESYRKEVKELEHTYQNITEYLGIDITRKAPMKERQKLDKIKD